MSNGRRALLGGIRLGSSTKYGDRGDPTGHLPTEGRQRQRSHQHMEHRIVTSFLPLKLGLTAFFHSMFAPTSTLA